MNERVTESDEELLALGLLDPAAPSVDEQLALVRLARAYGATIEEISAGIAEHRLHAVAAERVVLDGPRLTLRDAAAAAEIDDDFAQRLWRALGFPDAGLDAPVCTEHDVEAFVLFRQLRDFVGPDAAIRLAFTTGSSLARMADAAISTLRARVEAPLRSHGGTDTEVAEAFVAVASDLIPRLYPMIEAVHRRHLSQAAQRYSMWEGAPTLESTTFAVVGFADLVGFTALTQQFAATDLDELLIVFEQHVLDAIPPEGARLVKLIGDEAMFIAGSAEQAAAIARTLVRAAHEDPRLPDVRVGLGAGEVLVRDGDVFGPTVNRAARLVAVAEPSTVIVDGEVAARLPEDAVTARGERTLPGFDEPVAVFDLRLRLGGAR